MGFSASRVVVLSALAGAWSCAQEAQPIVAKGTLRAEPASLDFGEVDIGARKTLPLQIVRQGLRAEGLTLDWGLPFDRAFSHQLDDAAGLVQVTYAPTHQGDAASELVVQQAGAAAIRVQLHGVGARSQLQVSPTVLTFGAVPLGQSRARTVRVSSTSSFGTEVRVELDDTIRSCDEVGPAPFCYAGARTVPLLPAGAAELEVRFAPQAPIAQATARLRVRGCADCAPHDVRLEGRATEPSLTCTEAQPFDFVDVGVCATQRVTCAYASGDAHRVQTWRLSMGSSAEFRVVQPPAPGMLLPGQPAEIEVSYCPRDLGDDRATLEVEDDNADITQRVQSVALVGRGGGAPDIEVTPLALDFTSTLIAPTRKPILVRNVGLAPLVIGSIELRGGRASPFSTTVAGTVLQPGESLVLTIEFQPTQAGTVTDELRIFSNDPDEPIVTVALRGTGYDLPPCAYQIAPQSIEFGEVEVERSLRRGVEVRNVGGGDCLITGARLITGDAALAVPPLASAIIAAGSSAVVAVDFAPARVGVVTDRLELGLSNPMAPSVEVPLTAAGADATPLILPREVDFATVSPSCNDERRTVSVYNVGSAALTIASVVIEPTAHRSFALSGLPPLPRPVAPGAALTFEVAYRPGPNDADNAAAVLINGLTQTWTVALRGRGAASARHLERFEQSPSREVDLLLVLDTSGCNGEEHASLAENIGGLVDAAALENIDYHIAITTTDVEGGEDGRFFPVGAPRVVTRQTMPSPTEVLADLIMQVGLDGSANEQGLEGAYQALSPPLTRGVNRGFLRPEASLSIIAMSDEDDFSPNTTTFYAGYLKSIKGRYFPGSTTFSGVGGDPVGGCTGARGTSAPATRYAEVARQTGGTFASICTPDYGALVDELTPAALGLRARFLLAATPVAGTLEVTVDGVVVPEVGAAGQRHWVLDAAGPTLAFAPLSVPAAGAQLTVSYQTQCAGN